MKKSRLLFICGSLLILGAACKDKAPKPAATPATPAAAAPVTEPEAAPDVAPPAQVAPAPAEDGPAFTAWGPATVKRQTELHVGLAARDIKRGEPTEKDIQPAAGKVFVVVSFEQAPPSTPIPFSSPDTSLDLADGTKLRAYAVRVQGTKYEGSQRVAWPEANHIETEIWMTTYLPLAGEPPFTVVFEAPATASQGAFAVKGAKIPLSW